MPCRLVLPALGLALIAAPLAGQRQERFAAANNGPGSLALGTSKGERFDRLVMSGVLTAGFLTLAMFGNNPYFHVEQSFLAVRSDWVGVLAGGLINGVLGGLFARAMLRGAPGIVPSAWRHPQWRPRPPCPPPRTSRTRRTGQPGAHDEAGPLCCPGST